MAKIFCFTTGLIGLYLLKEWAFLAGVWLIGAAFAIRKPDRKIAGGLIAISLAAVLGVLVLHPALYGPEMDKNAGWWAQLASSALIAASIFSAMPRLNYPTWLVRTGDFSYSLYIIHFPILLAILAYSLNWMGHDPIRAFAMAVVAAVIAIAAAIAVAFIAERPGYFYRLLKGWLDAACARSVRLMRQTQG